MTAAEHDLQGDVVLLTGMSGGGKSVAMHALEDAGYFCVDNLPPEMIRSLVELFTHEGSKVERAAVVSDVRGGEFFTPLEGVIDELHARELPARVLFLDADDNALIGVSVGTENQNQGTVLTAGYDSGQPNDVTLESPAVNNGGNLGDVLGNGTAPGTGTGTGDVVDAVQQTVGGATGGGAGSGGLVDTVQGTVNGLTGAGNGGGLLSGGIGG